MALSRAQFAHAGLWKVFDGLTPNPPPVAEHGRCFRILSQLAIAKQPTGLPFKVHRLASGYAIDVMRTPAGTSRITYQWANAGPQGIDYEA